MRLGLKSVEKYALQKLAGREPSLIWFVYTLSYMRDALFGETQYCLENSELKFLEKIFDFTKPTLKI